MNGIYVVHRNSFITNKLQLNYPIDIHICRKANIFTTKDNVYVLLFEMYINNWIQDFVEKEEEEGEKMKREWNMYTDTEPDAKNIKW